MPQSISQQLYRYLFKLDTPYIHQTGLFPIVFKCGQLYLACIGIIEWIGVCFDQYIIRSDLEETECFLTSSIIMPF